MTESLKNKKENDKGNIICVRANGAIEVMSADEDVFSQAKDLLSGAQIEVVQTLIPHLVMLIDEEGKLKGLPLNWNATGILLSGAHGPDAIVGDAVFVDKRGEELCALKDSGYVENVLRLILGKEGAS